MKRNIKTIWLTLSILIILGLSAALLFLINPSNEMNRHVAITDLPSSSVPAQPPTLQTKPSDVIDTNEPQQAAVSVDFLNEGEYYYSESLFYENLLYFVMEGNEYNYIDENGDLICFGRAFDDDGQITSHFYKIKNNTYEAISPSFSNYTKDENNNINGIDVFGISRDSEGNFYILTVSNISGINEYSLSIYNKEFEVVEYEIPYDIDDRAFIRSNSSVVYNDIIYLSSPDNEGIIQLYMDFHAEIATLIHR